ncbi:MAG: hypothetical protein ACK5ZR_16815 [Gemmatimonadaceae bacterium]
MKLHTQAPNSRPPQPIVAGEPRDWLNLRASSSVGLRQFAYVSQPTLAISRVFRSAIGPSARDIPGESQAERCAFWAANPPSHSGMYATWTTNARAARALADQVEDVLGADRDFLSITADDVLSMWTTAVVSENAVRQVDLLLRVCRWAEQEYAVSRGYRALRLPRAWRKWIAAACTLPAKRVQGGQRYSASETGRLWQVLYSPDSLVHPVLRDAVLLGGEQRLGQVLMTTIDDVSKVGGVWVFRPPQAGTKLTSWIIVPAELTERFDVILAAASARPNGRLFPRSCSTLANAWRSLEQQAEVPHLGWFALRRSMLDICDNAHGELTRDTKNPLARSGAIVLDAISAHAPSRVRARRFIQSPVGDECIPTHTSVTWDILVSAMRVVRRARELAMECASLPTWSA